MAFKRKSILLAAAAVGAATSAVPAAALNIVLRPDASFTSQANGAQALFAFQKAANYWNQTLTGNTTINFAVSYAALAPNVIAQAGSTRTDVRASDIYAALAAKAGTALDAVAVTNLVPLSAAGGVGYRMAAPISTAGPGTHFGLNTAAGSVFDNDDTFNNTVIYANTSNLRELGITNDIYGNSLAAGQFDDASLTFSSAFNFDFDPSDGISTDTQDFISVAIHEMGHALGFVSGTDLYDFYGGDPATGGKRGPGFNVGLGVNWDNESALSVWDLFRYSTNGPNASGFDPATGKRYLQLDPNRGAAFSIDGVTPFNARNSSEAEFANLSTGRYNGDGQQASHWKDGTGFTDELNCFVPSRQVGIMDPTSGSCQEGIVTSNDLAAFDAMGYNLNFDILQNRGYTFTSAQAFQLAGLASVPEPATWAMMIGGFGLVGGAMRRRRFSTKVSFT